MKPDTLWPCAPLPHRSIDKQPPPELSDARWRAVRRLASLALHAEWFCDGREITESDPFKTPTQFVQECVTRLTQEYGVTLPAFIGLKMAGAIALCEDHPNVMVIDVRRHWGVSGLTPIRGDIAVFQGGHIGIVTKPQCRGCRTFECAEMTPVDAEGIPKLVIVEHWESTVTHLIRLVMESVEPAPDEVPEA